MRYFVYMMNTRAKLIHIGYCHDIAKMLKFYNDMPTILIDQETRLFKLLYISDALTHDQAEERWLSLTQMPKKELIKIIREANPKLEELIPGLNLTV